MNALWSEFDAKLTRILYGKSFLLSRMGQFPAGIMGKIFYFTPSSADAVYSGRAPGRTTGEGVIIGPDGLPQGYDLQPVPYDHAIFTAALATVAADIAAHPAHATWDDANRIVTVPVIPDTAYGGLPAEILDNSGVRPMGLCDHSLAAHTLLHQGAGDTEPKPYFVRENGAVPEKVYKYALAELVIEGQSTLDVPDTHNKYNCFRIHNLSQEPCVVSFSTHYSVTVAPFGCATVRRDSVTANYREGWNYFFKFERGDPRMFWFHCTQQDAGRNALIGGSTQMRVSNTMTANNLTNPAMLYDWIGAMAVPEDWMARYSAEGSGWGAMNLGGTCDIRYAWFLRDPSIVYDAYEANAAQFGDPSDPETLLGDLIHHQGEIIIARTSRTVIDPASGKLLTTWDAMRFNGYATIVEDFAEHGITVAENEDGDLTFVNAEEDICDLFPVGTNLFKRWDATNGETFPPMVSLHDNWDQNTPTYYEGVVNVPAPVIECLVFESMPSGLDPAPFGLANQAPTAVFQRNLQTTANTREWTDFTDVNDNVGHPVTVTGPDIEHTIVPDPVATGVLHGIHTKMVADILSLQWWGNPALSDQGTDYVTYTNKQLTLTDQGLVLAFDTTITGIEPAGGNSGLALSGDSLYWRNGKLKRTQVITFRGHGWGHTAEGSRSMASMAPRSGKRMIQRYITNEISGPKGADFGVQSVGSTETQHKVLRRMKLADLRLPDKAARFWRNTGGSVDAFIKNYQTPGWFGSVESPPGFDDRYAPRVLDYWNQTANMLALTTADSFLLPLDIEHYNGMAAAVNSLVTGYGLTCAALAWRVDGKILSLTPTQDTVPVPMDCFAAFPGGESSQSFGTGNLDTLALCQHLGLTIKTKDDLPDDLSGFTAVPQAGCARFVVTYTGEITSYDAVYNGDNTGPWWWEIFWCPGTITYGWSAALHVDRIDAGAQADGDGPTTWDPTTGQTIPSTLGDYCVCSNAGWDGAQFWMQGDLAAWQGSMGGPPWAPFPVLDCLATNAGQAGSAVVAQTGQVVQLTPEPTFPMGGRLCAANGLGSWTPPTLPADGTNPGDYYDIDSTVRPDYFEGSRIVWDGTAWQIGNSSYSDFNWVSLAEVTSLMAGFGLPMVFNELVIPLNLSFESASGEVKRTDGTIYTGTSTQEMTVSWRTINEGMMTAPPDPIPLDDLIATIPVNPQGLVSFKVGGIGAGNRFSTDAKGKWKMRVSPYALYSEGAKLADVKNFQEPAPDWLAECFVNSPPVLNFSAQRGDPEPGHAPSHDWGLSTGLGWGGLTSDVSRSNLLPEQLPANSFWGILAPTSDTGLLFQCGISEDAAAYWQYVQYGFLSVNSSGIDNASTFTICPTWLWNHDGDYWNADLFSGEKFIWMGLRPNKCFGAVGAPTVIQPGDGLTMLTAPAGYGADLLFNLHINAISLLDSIDRDDTNPDSDPDPIDS